MIERCKNLNQINQLHSHLITLGLSQNPAAVAPLISSAATSANPALFSYARAVFQNLRNRSTFLYNNMIRGYVQSNMPKPAILCYREMTREGLIRNNYTFTPLIKACSMVVSEFAQMGCLVHAHVVKLGFCCDPFVVSALIEFYALNGEMGHARELFDEIPVRDVVLWTAMIDGYGKSGDVGMARVLFDEMPERNVVSWSAMMAGYSRAGDFGEVLRLYGKMGDVGVKANESVLVSALTSCAHLGALAQGLWIHSYAKRCKYDSNSILATAMVDMYSKCGCVDLALAVFEEIRNKDSGAWNAIISGVAMNGDAMKSLELFDEMVLSGIQPTEATFVAILAACTHAKLVDKGLSLFEDMSKVYKIEPRAEHLACVVDLLARSGKIEEAEKFIDEKIGGIDKADANVWGAMLGACRIHGKVDVGDRIWRKLGDKGVADYGIHVLACNMYKEAGWEAEAMRVRSAIKEIRTKKTPGSSAIEVNGSVEEFVAGNVLHPQAEKICKTLDSLLCNKSYSIILDEYV